MNTICRYAIIACTAGLLLAGAAPAMAQNANVAATSCAPLTNVQRRIVDKADQGVPALRHFVGMTHFIYGIDMIDVAESLDQWRASAACTTKVAEASQKQG